MSKSSEDIATEGIVKSSAIAPLSVEALSRENPVANYLAEPIAWTSVRDNGLAIKIGRT